MDYDTACESRLTPRCVMDELARNGFSSSFFGDYVETSCECFGEDGGKEIEIKHFVVGRDGKINGKEVLDWLGY
jgi:hypothetical protein